MAKNQRFPRVGFGIMILNSKNQVLLGKRNDDPKKASSKLHGEGTWTMPGGKLEYDESFEEGARREVLEETDIRLNDVEIICVNNDKNEHAHFVTIGMFSDSFSGEAHVMEPDEIVEWKWFDLNKLPKNIYFPSAKVLENFKKEKFYIMSDVDRVC